MKSKPIDKLRNQTLNQLEKQLTQASQELIKLRLNIKIGKQKNIKAASNKRQEIAILSTLITEKKLSQIQSKKTQSSTSNRSK